MALNLAVALDGGERIVSVQLTSADTMATLRAVVEAESGLPVDAQGPLLKDGKPLLAPPEATLSAAGLADGDLLALSPPPPPPAHPGAPAADPPRPRRMPTATELLAAVRADPALASRLPPALAAAVAGGDPSAVEAALAAAGLGGGGGGGGGGGDDDDRARIDALNADPFDPAAQAAIEARVRQAAVDASLESALEHHPEAFGDVVMLYVHVSVNGKTLAAFVDSGAQRSIMSVETAAEAGLAHLIDARFAGVAVGVGSGKIVGRIHAVPVRAGTAPDAPFMPMSITVMDQKGMPFLLGLDQMRRYRCTIDLSAGGPGGGALRFPPPVGVDLPFLPEHALPPSARGGGAGGFAQGHTEAGSGGGGGGAPAAGPPPPPAPAPAPAAPAAAPPNPAVARLAALGFSEAAAAAALAAAGGNEEVAASMLFDEGGFG